jgi:hypothetical protein
MLIVLIATKVHLLSVFLVPLSRLYLGPCKVLSPVLRGSHMNGRYERDETGRWTGLVFYP